MQAVIVWFRQDLRLTDNVALASALAEADRVVLAYVLDTGPDPWAPGAASRWWLHGSLASLGAAAEALGGKLVLRRGEPVAELQKLVDEVDAGQIYFSRSYDPRGRALEHAVRARFPARGVQVRRFPGTLLTEPEHLRTQTGTRFKVFTPFWRALKGQPEPREPIPSPDRLPASPACSSDALESWQLRPRRPDWAAGFTGVWRPGEAGAQDALDQFLSDAVAEYGEARDRPDQEGTSRLSPHLHFGELSPRQIWTRARLAGQQVRGAAAGIDSFLRELGWREFSYHLLYHSPELPDAPLRPDFARFQWRDDAQALQAWQQGSTGVPLVDAGMRQLWETGWMHNRVRMIAASFLVKNLLLPWQAGESWFWDTLVDADLASNAASWQWVAGCGTDAAPYFRIFNPVRQGEKFDPHGHYVKRWVPELAPVPAKYVHQPHRLPQALANEIGFQPGRDYPLPLVDLTESRQRALAAYGAMRAP